MAKNVSSGTSAGSMSPASSRGDWDETPATTSSGASGQDYSGLSRTTSDMDDTSGAQPGGGSSKGLMSKASEKLMDAAEQQKEAGASFVDDMAGAVRRAAGELDGQVPQAAEYIRYAADQMETMSDAIRRRDMGQMLSELQSFARQQPTAFLGATFLAGFAAVRFFKSSSNASSGSHAAMRPAHARSGMTSPPSGMARYGEYGSSAGESASRSSEL